MQKMLTRGTYLEGAAVRRLLLSVVLSVSLSLGLVAGTYSGIVHAHEHSSIVTDHHQDEDAPRHGEGSSSRATGTEVGFSGELGSAPLSDHVHEHPAEVTLSLARALHVGLVSASNCWRPTEQQSLLIHKSGRYERPPRLT